MVQSCAQSSGQLRHFDFRRGRDSGFIAAFSVLVAGEVNFCLVPEVEFSLNAFLSELEQRMHQRGHAVIVVAEGAGQNMLESTGERDASGNIQYADIGMFFACTAEPGSHEMVGRFDDSRGVTLRETGRFEDELLLEQARLGSVRMGNWQLHSGEKEKQGERAHWLKNFILRMA